MRRESLLEGLVLIKYTLLETVRAHGTDEMQENIVSSLVHHMLEFDFSNAFFLKLFSLKTYTYITMMKLLGVE